MFAFGWFLVVWVLLSNTFFWVFFEKYYCLGDGFLSFAFFLFNGGGCGDFFVYRGILVLVCGGSGFVWSPLGVFFLTYFFLFFWRIGAFLASFS